MSKDERKYCICNDPENCTEPTSVSICRKQAGLPGKGRADRPQQVSEPGPIHRALQEAEKVTEVRYRKRSPEEITAALNNHQGNKAEIAEIVTEYLANYHENGSTSSAETILLLRQCLPYLTDNQPNKELKEKYYELLFQVADKYPGETRHETALRYLREAKTSGPAGSKQSLKGE